MYPRRETITRGMAVSHRAYTPIQASTPAVPRPFLFLQASREIQISHHEFDALRKTTQEQILFVYKQTMCGNDALDSHSGIRQALRFLGVGPFEYDNLLANWVNEWNKLLFHGYDADLKSLMEQASRRLWGLDELKAIAARWMQGKDEDRLLEQGKKRMEIHERWEEEKGAKTKRRLQTAFTEISQQPKREEATKGNEQQNEWDKVWRNYQKRWNDLKVGGLVANRALREQIPWPVKSGLWIDVEAPNVAEFFQKGAPKDQNFRKMMMKECQKWHPDKMKRVLEGSMVTSAEQKMLDMVARQVTSLLDAWNKKSADFIG